MSSEQAADRSGRLRAWAGIGSRLGLVVLFVIAAMHVGHWIESRLADELEAADRSMLRWAIIAALVAYILLMALPFVPGVEIGLTLLAMFGPKIAPAVYVATVLALVLSFLLGRLVPPQAAVRLLAGSGLRRAAGLLRQIDAFTPEERLSLLTRNASSRVPPALLRYRHVALALALNLPGNSLIGGGGGIGLAAGFSRLFGLVEYALTIAVAVAPVPLLVYLLSG